LYVLSAELAGQSGSPPLFSAPDPSSLGIRWKHDNARSSRRFLPETMSAGVAIFDYDRDGWADVLFVNSGSSSFFQPPKPLHPALFRNQGDGTFQDVTQEAGLDVDLFGMGAAVADYDNDGCADFLLTGFGRSLLLRNGCDGRFIDVSRAAGVMPPAWSTSAAWLDYDQDGFLDLYVLRFLDYSSLASCKASSAYGGAASKETESPESYYCSPVSFPPTASRLYRNRGDGTFEDTSVATGVAELRGKGLGVVAADINNDRWVDLFQANDMVPNFLLLNQGGKKFEDRALEGGVAYSQDGRVRSGMGVDAADIDGDGNVDLFVANIDQQTFSLYRNEGGEVFSDISFSAGVAPPTRNLSGWGLKFFDYNNDGSLDLILANGHPDDKVDERLMTVTYKEPLLLFEGDGRGHLKQVSEQGGTAFGKRFPARGLAVGDLDNDGFPDVVVSNNGELPLLLHNRAVSRNHWLGLRLEGRMGNRDAIGAIVRWSVSGTVRLRHVVGGGSYLSSHDPRLVLGLGKAAQADWVEVQWPAPSKRIERFHDLRGGAYTTLVEGQGEAKP
jgi:hypothetical protein